MGVDDIVELGHIFGIPLGVLGQHGSILEVTDDCKSGLHEDDDKNGN